MIRTALVCSTAVLLSGCSWFGGWDGGSSHARKMNLELAVGIDPSIDGDVISTAFDTSGTAELAPAGFNDVYETNYNYQLGATYAVTDTIEVTGAVNYSHAEGKTFDVGTAGADAISADFDDLETYGAEIGVRKYFRNKTFAHLLSPAVSPYVGASVGIKHVEGTGATLSSAGFAGAGLPAQFDAEWYDDSIVPTGQVTVGAEWRASRNFAIGLETGVRYTGELDAGDAVLAAVGWDEARSSAEKVSIPVTLRGRFKF